MKIKLCVLFGGKSVEHEVSIISALQAMQNLNKNKYEIIPVYFTRDSRFYTGKGLTEIENFKDLDKLIKKSDEVMFYYNGKKTSLVSLGITKKKTYIDIVFPIVHGTNVEDGALQGFLRTYQVPFVGCEVLASATGMEKTTMKTILEKAGIPVLPYISFSSKEWVINKNELIDEIEKEIGYPIIVKPTNLGSSIGISAASDRISLIEAIDTARKYALKIMVERKIEDLKEINCAVYGDKEIQNVSECERPVSSSGILSYADKYLGGSKSKGMSGLDRELPAKIEKYTEENIKELAKKTFCALDCSGVARIDFMIDQKNGSTYVNEINTIPGSLAFYLFEIKGIKYSELLDEMIKFALKREREESNIDFEYKTDILSVKGNRGKKL